jgi:hypothetical protein
LLTRIATMESVSFVRAEKSQSNSATAAVETPVQGFQGSPGHVSKLPVKEK